MNGILEALSGIWNIRDAFFEGATVTVQLFFFTMLFSIPAALPVALGSNCKIPPLRWLCKAYIWIFRGTPLMLQLFFFYYFVFPYIFNAPQISALTIAILTFTLNYGAYLAEIYRGGIESIHKGQYEAAYSLGLGKATTMFGIIIPQTVKRVLPSVSNEMITLVKDTALVSCITLSDLFRVVTKQVSARSNPLLYIAPAIFYLLFTFVLTLLTGYLEKKFSVKGEKGSEGK